MKTDDRRTRHRWLFLALLATLSGCSGSASQDALDSARSAVETGLEAWKKGEPAAKFKKSTPSVEFTDEDWTRGFRLTDYEILKTEGKPTAPLRCTVSLTLKGRNGKAVQKEVVYEVRTGTPTIVARDPYF
jgi:hypothetical protein